MVAFKKIHVSNVRTGMYIHEICGSWMDHSFWKTSFLVSDEKTLKRLTSSSIHEVWIDVSKGVDVLDGSISFSEEDEKIRIDDSLQFASNNVSELQSKLPLYEEIERARAIHDKAKKAVVTLFQEARMGQALQLEDLETLVDDINQSLQRNSSAMLSLARLKNKDDYTYLHSVSVCALMVALGRQLGLNEEALREAGMAGLLHDIGKAMMPDAVLNKPGRLSQEEFEIMKGHPKSGWSILKELPRVGASALDVCLHHHERLDGTGYPEKLSGEAISLFARMGTVCDVYDAITSARCYKDAWEPAEAIRKMADWKEGNYDETVFHAFVKTVGIYPVGTLVKLKSGRLGVVAEQSKGSLLTPIVTVFYSSRSNELLLPERVDLSKSMDSILNIECASTWKFDSEMLQRMGQFPAN